MNLKKFIIIGLIVIALVLGFLGFVQLKNPAANSKIKTTAMSLKVCKEAELERVITYLKNNVPEIDAFLKQITQASKGEVKLIMRCDSFPDKNSTAEYHDYYLIYVGENHPNHTVRWNSFYIKSDLNQILVADLISGEVLTLAEWRKIKK